MSKTVVSICAFCSCNCLSSTTVYLLDRNLQKIRLCGPKLNISCTTPPRRTLEAEAKWVPPTMEDFEREAIAMGYRLDMDPDGKSPENSKPMDMLRTIYMGVDVDSNTPRSMSSAAFASCSTNPVSCAPTLLGEWARLGDAPLSALPTKPDIWLARLWANLVGDAAFDTAVGFFLPPPNNTAIPTPACTTAGLAPQSKCVRVLGFRGANRTSTVLFMVNLDSNNTYVDKGDTGRGLYYLHRKQWQLTVPSLTSTAVSLNGKLLAPSHSGPLPYIEPLSLAGNAAKAALTLPPLSVTVVDLGLVPAVE